MNNLTFEVKAILGLESTIQEGQPAGLPDGRPDGRTEKLGIEPATTQSELGLGLRLAIYIMNILKLYTHIGKKKTLEFGSYLK